MQPTPPPTPNPHPTPASTENSKKNEGGRFESAKFIIEAVTLLLAIGFLILNYYQWKTANDSLEEMRKQTDVTNRPWVYATLSSLDSMYFENGRLSFPIEFEFRNVGHSVASRVILAVEHVPAGEAPEITHERTCSDSRKLNHSDRGDIASARIVFPEETPKIGLYIAIDRNLIVPTNGDDLTVDQLIVGCIDYRSPTGTHHQSGFAYQVFGTFTTKSLREKGRLYAGANSIRWTNWEPLTGEHEFSFAN